MAPQMLQGFLHFLQKLTEKKRCELLPADCLSPLLSTSSVLCSGAPQQFPQIFAPLYDKVPKETQSSKKISGKNNYNTPTFFFSSNHSNNRLVSWGY